MAPQNKASLLRFSIAYALQGTTLHLDRVTSGPQRHRIAQGIRRNDLDALRYAFPAS